MTNDSNPSGALTDSEYVLSMIDETFASVPQIKAHHDRIRKIAARLAATPQATQEASPQALEVSEAIEWLKSDEVNAGPRTVKAIATVLAALSPAKRVAEPVAWIVYLPSIQTREIFDSQEDAGYVDWLTNYPDAQVTPLYTHAAPLARVPLWQPIETAPKDGATVILGYISGHPSINGHSEEGYYMGDAARNHWGRTGWFATGDDVLCDQPSHPDVWMPLLAPPSGITATATPGAGVEHG